MTVVVDRTGWSLKQLMVEDVKYFFLYIIGLAPLYKGEYSEYFDNEPVSAMYGGKTTFSVVLWLAGTITLFWVYGSDFLQFAISDASSPATLCLSLVSYFIGYMMFSFLVVMILSSPFNFLNSFTKGFKKVA